MDRHDAAQEIRNELLGIVPDGDDTPQAGVQTPVQTDTIKQNPDGVTELSVALSGLCLTIHQNGGCTPACNLSVLRTYEILSIGY